MVLFQTRLKIGHMHFITADHLAKDGIPEKVNLKRLGEV